MTEHVDAIDIVLPWVDGDDPSLKARRVSYMDDGKESLREDIAGSSRYKSLGEIKFCVASINLFAPFVRKIFIVTDGQDPELESYMKEIPTGLSNWGPSLLPNFWVPTRPVACRKPEGAFPHG